MRITQPSRLTLAITACALCLAILLIITFNQRREYVGEFPKSGFNSIRVEYPEYEYVPKSPPVPVEIPSIDIGSAIKTPLKLGNLPSVTNLGRLDLSGSINSTKAMQADFLVKATIFLPPVGDSPPQVIANDSDMLTPHKDGTFKIKLPIPEFRGTFRIQLGILSPDLTPMQNVLAEGMITIE